MAKSKKKLSGYERFMALSDEEKEREVAVYDLPIEQIPTRPLRARDKALHARAARRAKAERGRPRVGEGAMRITTTVEGGLLKRADAYAKKNGLTRAEVIARGLAAVVGGGAAA